MSMRRCKWILGAMWFGVFLMMVTILVVQSLSGYYGGDVVSVWSWFLPTLLPTASLIGGVLIADAKGVTDQTRNVSAPFFALTAIVSGAYLLILAVTVLGQPLFAAAPLEVMKLSHLWLSPLQGLAAGFIGVFFVKKK